MNKEFLSQVKSTELKELGFDDECLCAWKQEGGYDKYTRKRTPIRYRLTTHGNPFGFDIGRIYNSKLKTMVAAPLWQQAFDWFREVKKFNFHIEQSGNSWIMRTELHSEAYETYNEARSECLDYLIKQLENKTR